MTDLWLAILHQVLAFGLVAMLTAEPVLVHRGMAAPEAARVVRLDAGYMAPRPASSSSSACVGGSIAPKATPITRPPKRCAVSASIRIWSCFSSWPSLPSPRPWRATRVSSAHGRRAQALLPSRWSIRFVLQFLEAHGEDER